MRNSTSPFSKNPPATNAGETATTVPETSDTKVVRVRGATTPWERTTKVTGSRLASATSTNRVGGGTGF